jgi:hypothetical protein
MNIDPAIALSEHPFFRDHVLIFETAPMRRGYALVKIPLLLGMGGAFMQAPPGGGKTAFLLYVAHCLRQQYPGLPVYEVSTHRLAPTALRSFPYRFCRATGKEKPPRGGLELRTELERSITEQAEESLQKRAVALIDEGQVFKLNELYVLKDTFNEMTYKGLGLSSFICGEEPKLKNNLRALKRGGEDGLVRRFAANEIPSIAYVSAEDVLTACKAIDDCRWPELDGKTVLESVLPISTAASLRMENYATWIYRGFNKKALKASEVFGVVRWLMITHLHRDNLKIAFTEDDIKKAIALVKGAV